MNCQAEEIKEKIGYPDYIMNDTALNLDYEGVSQMLAFINVMCCLKAATMTADNRKPLLLDIIGLLYLYLTLLSFLFF